MINKASQPAPSSQATITSEPVVARGVRDRHRHPIALVITEVVSPSAQAEGGKEVWRSVGVPERAGTTEPGDRG